MRIEEMGLMLAQVSSVFTNFTLTKEAIKTWHSLFIETDFETFHAALRICVKEPGRAFFPAPGEVNKIILKMKTANLPDADEVWTRLLGFASGGRSDLAYQYVSGNEAGERALNQVTFHSLRYADIETELPWIRKEFMRAYNEIKESAAERGYISIGRDEATKVLGGLVKQLSSQKEIQ